VLLSTRRERRLEGLLIAASALGLALLANHCVPDVQIVDNEPDAGLGGASGAAGQAGAVNTGGTDTGTPGLIGGPCLPDDTCTVGQCAANGRCVTGEYGDPCEENGHCIGNHCEVQPAGGGGVGGATTGTCGKYPGLTVGCSDDPQCISNECIGSVCALGIDGSACYADNDCDLRYCFDGTCRLLSTGANCDPDQGGNASCLSGDCHPILRTCQLGPGDAPCTIDTDCMTGSCTGDSAEATCVAPVVVAQTRRVQGVALRGDEFLDVEFRIMLNGEGPVPLGELAFVYFYYKDTDRDQQLFDIPATGILTADEIQVSLVQPVENWRMAIVTFATNAELTQATLGTGDLYVQVNTPALGSSDRYDQAADFSWPELVPDTEFGTVFAENTRTVICRNVGGTWQREFGNSPSQIPDPCSWL